MSSLAFRAVNQKVWPQSIGPDPKLKQEPNQSLRYENASAFRKALTKDSPFILSSKWLSLPEILSNHIDLNGDLVGTGIGQVFLPFLLVTFF